jgi:hypothetical protein
MRVGQGADMAAALVSAAGNLTKVQLQFTDSSE